MFTFERDGTAVKLTVESGLAKDNQVFPFVHECGSGPAAELRAQYLYERFRDELESIREDAYEAGHRDGQLQLEKETDHAWTWTWRWHECDWWLANGKKRRA